jgi:hypothetical protein
VGITEGARGLVLKLWACAALAAAAGWGVRTLIGPAHPWVTAGSVLGVFGIVYLTATAVAGIEEARSLLSRVSPGKRA